jgi:hypothetical protein
MDVAVGVGAAVGETAAEGITMGNGEGVVKTLVGGKLVSVAAGLPEQPAKMAM